MSDSLISDFLTQLEFSDADFAMNTEPRCPVVLLLDNSYSMSGAPINALNQGLREFKIDLMNDPLAQKRCEIAVVSFGPVQIVSDFQTVDAFEPVTLLPAGNTPLGGAVLEGLNMLEQRKQAYRRNGVTYYRPWVFLITDGAPTDQWQAAADAVKRGEANKAFSFYAVGVEGADFNILSQFSMERSPIKLKGLSFIELFRWLSASMQSVSRSTPGGAPAALPSPAGWGEAPV